MAQPYRFRPAFGQVKSLFRGARKDTYPRFTGLLDLYPGAAAAYSLERLAADTSNVVRVRRSSDNAEQAFTAQEVSDGTLTSFTGAGDGFVETWYDQSGNGRDAGQSTAASQPKIVDGGVVVTENNTPTIDFTGDKFLALTSNTQFVSVFSIQRATAAFQGLLGAGNTYIHTTSNVSGRVYKFNAFSNTREIYVNGAAYANESVTSLGYHLVNVNFNGSEPFGQIGANPDYNSFSPSFPKIGVMVYYNSDQSANRAAIEANLADQYGITLA